MTDKRLKTIVGARLRSPFEHAGFIDQRIDTAKKLARIASNKSRYLTNIVACYGPTAVIAFEQGNALGGGDSSVTQSLLLTALWPLLRAGCSAAYVSVQAQNKLPSALAHLDIKRDLYNQQMLAAGSYLVGIAEVLL